MNKIDGREFRNCCGRFATGITVVTTEREGEIHGMTANGFLSVSLDPPLIAVSVGQRARMHQILSQTMRYGVSFLNESGTNYSNHFAGRPDDTLEIPWIKRQGMPLLADALGHLVARVRDAHEAGDLAASSGTIVFQGDDITQVAADKRCHMGIGRTRQIPQPFNGMTVYENVLVGAMYGVGQNERDAQAFCVDILRQTGLLPLWNDLAGRLRLLERKRLELARALATKPTLLLLDEIAGGLTEHEVHELIEVVQRIRQSGVTIIWIEHIVHALISVVDTVLAINFGNKLAEGTPQAVISSPAFQEIYFGVESIRLNGGRG